MPYYWTCPYCGANLDPEKNVTAKDNEKEDDIHDGNEITVEAPDLAASILKLAEAIASGPDPSILTPDEPLPVASYPTARHRPLRPLLRPL